MGLKICQLCAVDFTMQKLLLPLIDGLRADGFEVTAVCSDGPFVSGMRASGYHVETVSIARGMNPLSALRSVVVLTRLFRRERFAIVHVHTPVASLVGRLAAWLARTPQIVYTAHGFYFHDDMPAWKRATFVGLERVAGWVTDVLFCQSAEDAATAVAEGIAPAEAVKAIGNGVDVSRFDPAQVMGAADVRALLGVPAATPVVGIIGRQVREKGYAELLGAATALATEFPDMCVLLVGGRLESDHDTSIEPALAQARDVLGDRLIEAGPRDDTPAMLAAMDVFCLPSYREGMPRTIVEAMMMAKPVVATDIRGCREEVVAGETGWLVPVRDTVALARAIAACLGDPAAAARMGAAGRRRALALYDEREVVALQVRELRARWAARSR